MTPAELRRLAEQLPPGAALTLDRATLLDVLATTAATTTYTVAMLAEQLRRSPSTVRGWLEAERFPGAYQLPGAKRPGAWRIPQAAIEAFMARGVKPSRQDGPEPTIARRADTGARPRRAQTRDAADLGSWRKAVA